MIFPRYISNEQSMKDDNDGEEKEVQLPIKGLLQCLGAAWAESNHQTQSKNGASVAACLSKVLIGMHSWHVKVATAETAKVYASNICRDVENVAASWIHDLIPGSMRHCPKAPH